MTENKQPETLTRFKAWTALAIWEWHLENDGAAPGEDGTGAAEFARHRENVGTAQARDDVLNIARQVDADTSALITQQDKDDTFIGPADWAIVPALMHKGFHGGSYKMDDEGRAEVYGQLKKEWND